jgi:hypothetical protein
MKIILHTNPETGIVAITIPAYNDGLRDPDLTDDEILSRVLVSIPGERNPRVAEFETLLPRDLFRDAWEDSDGVLVVNMTKARVIHLAEIRRVRDAELVKKDVPFMRAVEAEDTDAQATIKAEKQALRDIPATFDITTDVDTPEKLKAKWPTELPARE